jgi:hypothetical protein
MRRKVLTFFFQNEILILSLSLLSSSSLLCWRACTVACARDGCVRACALACVRARLRACVRVYVLPVCVRMGVPKASIQTHNTVLIVTQRNMHHNIFSLHRTLYFFIPTQHRTIFFPRSYRTVSNIFMLYRKTWHFIRLVPNGKTNYIRRRKIKQFFFLQRFYFIRHLTLNYVFILSPENIGFTLHTPILAIKNKQPGTVACSLHDTILSNSPSDTGFTVLYASYRTTKLKWLVHTAHSLHSLPYGTQC